MFRLPQINSHSINKSTEKINLHSTLRKGVVKCAAPKIIPSYAATTWLNKTVILPIPNDIRPFKQNILAWLISLIC
jgi:hypothetical protein